LVHGLAGDDLHQHGQQQSPDDDAVQPGQRSGLHRLAGEAAHRAPGHAGQDDDGEGRADGDVQRARVLLVGEVLENDEDGGEPVECERKCGVAF